MAVISLKIKRLNFEAIKTEYVFHNIMKEMLEMLKCWICQSIYSVLMLLHKSRLFLMHQTLPTMQRYNLPQMIPIEKRARAMSERAIKVQNTVCLTHNKK